MDFFVCHMTTRAIFLTSYIWLLLCYAQNARSNLIDAYEALSRHMQFPEVGESLPVQLGVDPSSGCLCRASQHRDIVVCFGNYDCKTFPRVKVKCEKLRVRTTVIVKILRGQLDSLYPLKELEIEANHKLQHLERGLFKNLTSLQHLSISYNTGLRTIGSGTFEGLKNLQNLTLVNNGFTTLLDITIALKPSILPSLKSLALSENTFERITEHSFAPMKGSPLSKINVNLCRLDYIHPNAFLPLTELKNLHVGENDLNASLIGDFLLQMLKNGINLTDLNLSAMGFRKHPPRALLEVIALTKIKILILSQNQFEIIHNDTFPRMVNIELIDLRKVLAISIEPKAFDPFKFPNLKVLLLGGNNLPGLHKKHLSNQLNLLDISSNKGSPANPTPFEMDRDTFCQSTDLRILILSYNRIKAIFNYTFTGLVNLKILSMENGTLYRIGPGTFKHMKHLEILNIGNNPLVVNQNFKSSQFEGLNELKVLIMKNCGIKKFYDDDNIFEMMPNLTQLILRNNQLMYLTAETLKPLKFLELLDLSENLIVSWWRPLFLASAVKPRQLYLTNNKISHFSISMIEDISYLLENKSNSVEIELINNVFTCDCNAMYKTYLWMQVNGSREVKQYFDNSNVRCSNPDVWANRRVADYLASARNLRCLVYKKITSIMVLMWTAPSLVTIILVVMVAVILYKYRIYIRYWLFLAKLALGRKIVKKTLSAKSTITRGYNFDAFISYCNEDRDFVCDMVSQLESFPPHLKLCIYERDFEIGSFISESVLKSINESKFIILVISNNFAKSQWCRWETQLAEYHRIFLEDGTSYDPMVLIKLGEIDNKYMTTTLKYLLKTKIYHAWNENDTEEFWQKLRNVLTKKL